MANSVTRFGFHTSPITPATWFFVCTCLNHWRNHKKWKPGKIN